MYGYYLATWLPRRDADVTVRGDGIESVMPIIHFVRCSHQSHYPGICQGNTPCGRALLTVNQFGWILSFENDICSGVVLLLNMSE
jgi:hypothetical protein